MSVTTSKEALLKIEQKQEELRAARWDYDNSLLREQQQNEQKAHIGVLTERVKKLTAQIAALKKTPSVEKYENIKKWQSKIYDHLTTTEFLLDDDLDELYTDLLAL